MESKKITITENVIGIVVWTSLMMCIVGVLILIWSNSVLGAQILYTGLLVLGLDIFIGVLHITKKRQ